jgi:hypothetical protein
MSGDSHSMKVYPPKCSSGAKASDRLQEYLTQCSAGDGDMISPRLCSNQPDTVARSHAHAHAHAHAGDGSLASVEAALIDNHIQALPLSSPSAAASLSSRAHSNARVQQLPTKEKWKQFALNVLTCIPQQDQDEACEGFLEAMREFMSQQPVQHSSGSAPFDHDSRHADRSSLNGHTSSLWHEQTEPSSSGLFDDSQLGQDIMPRLEELLHMLRSPR